MTSIIRFIHRLPPYLTSGLILAAILWLTLAPHPTPDVDIPLFPGADKVVHAIMFGALAGALAIDSTRRRPMSYAVLTTCAAAAAITGAAIEELQLAMHLGRSFEWADIAADTIGAILAAILLKAINQPKKNR